MAYNWKMFARNAVVGSVVLIGVPLIAGYLEGPVGGLSSLLTTKIWGWLSVLHTSLAGVTVWLGGMLADKLKL